MSVAVGPSAVNSTSPGRPELFPMPLTALEAFMVTDARPNYPMMCDLELHFAGCLERAPFAAALKLALARAPLFQAKLIRVADVPSHWMPCEQLPQVDWAEQGTPRGEKYDGVIDLTQEIGLRIWVRTSATHSTLLIHFHHACADGIGALGFIEDLLAAYANQFPASPAIELRPLEPVRLRSRGAANAVPPTWYQRLTEPWVGLRESIKFFWQKPTPLATVSRSSHVDVSQVGLQSFVCTAEVELGLRAEAKRTGATVNDILIRELFVTLARWNSHHDVKLARRNVRILMPQNLRERIDRTLPATNMLGFAFVTRSMQQCAQPAALLDSLKVETDAVRRGQLSRYFLGSLESLRSLGRLPQLLQSSFCFATAVLTNVGDPTRRFVARFPRTAQGVVCGNVTLEGMTGVPPLRPGTRVVVGIINLGRKLSVSMKCDATLYSAADVGQLLDDYRAQLVQTANGAAR